MKMLGEKESDTILQHEKFISKEDYIIQKNNDETSDGVSFEEGEILF